jgi:DUF1365 family protein
MNFKMVKCGIVVLTGREKADMAVDFMLEPWWTRGREKANMMWERVRYSQVTTKISLRGQVEEKQLAEEIDSRRGGRIVASGIYRIKGTYFFPISSYN